MKYFTEVRVKWQAVIDYMWEHWIPFGLTSADESWVQLLLTNWKLVAPVTHKREQSIWDSNLAPI